MLLFKDLTCLPVNKDDFLSLSSEYFFCMPPSNILFKDTIFQLTDYKVPFAPKQLNHSYLVHLDPTHTSHPFDESNISLPKIKYQSKIRFLFIFKYLNTLYSINIMFFYLYFQRENTNNLYINKGGYVLMQITKVGE